MIETCSEVRSFVIEQLREMARGKGMTLPDISDDVDLLDAGLIDSMGFVELIAAVEGFLGREVDLASQNMEQLTTLGGFVRVMTAV